MVGLQVEFYWYQIGAASFLHAFFSTVCFRLEQGNWGSKFPSGQEMQQFLCAGDMIRYILSSAVN